MKVNLKKLQERKEKQYQEQIVFMAMLGTAQACRNNGISLGVDFDKRPSQRVYGKVKDDDEGLY